MISLKGRSKLKKKKLLFTFIFHEKVNLNREKIGKNSDTLNISGLVAHFPHSEEEG